MRPRLRRFRFDRGTVACVLILTIMASAAATAQALAAHKPKAGQSGLPIVSTGSVGGGGRLRGSTVELRGSIDPSGEAATYYFQYGPTTAYGAQTPSATLPASTTKIKVTQIATGLEPGYHYRLVATNGHGTTDGADRAYISVPGQLKRPLRITLVRPPAGGYPVGSSISIAGTLSGLGAAGHEVVLQASPYPYRAAFATVGSPQTSNFAGRFSFPVASLQRSTRYRVATLDSRTTYSPVITELAAVRVTFHVRSAAHGGLARLYGTVSPAVVGARVLFQLQKAAKVRVKRFRRSEGGEERAEEEPRYANTKFGTSVKRATRTISRFSSVVAILLEGEYRAYVQVRKGPLASGYSTSILIHATTTKKRRRRKG